MEINDIILFRAEIEVAPEYLNTEFFLEIELHFSNLEDIGGSEQWQEIADCVEEKAKFKLVQTQKYKIHCLSQGMTEFVPVNFQDQYFSILNCYIQSVLLDYRFRVKTYEQIQQQYFESGSQPPITNSSQGFKCDTVAHFFFADDQGILPSSLELRQVDLIYNDYIRVMTIMYEKLKNTYNTFVNRFLSEEQKAQSGIQLEVSRFTLEEKKEEEKQSTVNMKDGDEDLVEDESTVLKQQDEMVVNESTAE